MSQQALLNAMQSKDIAMSLYKLIPKSKRKDFIEFAKSFGMSERKVRDSIARL